MQRVYLDGYRCPIDGNRSLCGFIGLSVLLWTYTIHFSSAYSQIIVCLLCHTSLDVLRWHEIGVAITRIDKPHRTSLASIRSLLILSSLASRRHLICFFNHFAGGNLSLMDIRDEPAARHNLGLKLSIMWPNAHANINICKFIFPLTVPLFAMATRILHDVAISLLLNVDYWVILNK